MLTAGGVITVRRTVQLGVAGASVPVTIIGKTQLELECGKGLEKDL